MSTTVIVITVVVAVVVVYGIYRLCRGSNRGRGSGVDISDIFDIFD